MLRVCFNSAEMPHIVGSLQFCVHWGITDAICGDSIKELQTCSV